VTALDIRRVFSDLIFNVGKPIKSISIYDSNVQVEYKVEYKDNAKLPYFPEIEEIVEEFDLKWVRYAEEFKHYYAFVGEGLDVNIYINFSRQDEIQRFLKDVRYFKRKIEKISKSLALFLPSIRYSLNEEYLRAYFTFRIGFHSKFIRKYVEDKKIFRSGLKYIGGISILYGRSSSEEFWHCYCGTTSKEIGNVAIIKGCKDSGGYVSIQPEHFIGILRQIIKDEKKNIRSLLKYMVLEK